MTTQRQKKHSFNRDMRPSEILKTHSNWLALRKRHNSKDWEQMINDLTARRHRKAMK